MPAVQPSVAEMTRPVDYPATLEAAWLDHLAPRAADAPTVISTFAGGGGSSLGYSMAGYRELLAVEWDANAVETLRLNFPGMPIYHGDIAKLSVERCLEMAGTSPGELDVLDGSPPCQGFSTAGKRVLDDPRNGLFKEYVRLLRGLNPRAFVMENVSGMVKGKMKLVFVEILRELKASGYKVKARLLNAMYYGVPQSRQRIIFVGVRDDVAGEPGHPKAIANPISFGQAITGCKIENPPPLQDNRFTRLWNRVPIGGALDDVLGKGSNQNNMVKPDPARPYPTVPKSQTNRGAACMVHFAEKRMISIPEIQRIQGFPDQFRFSGDYFDAWERIGNSVPPLLARAIARHIRSEILEAASAASRRSYAFMTSSPPSPASGSSPAPRPPAPSPPAPSAGRRGGSRPPARRTPSA